MCDENPDLLALRLSTNANPVTVAHIEKLKELEKLVKKGIVRQDVYDKAVEDVISWNASHVIKKTNLSKVKRTGRISKMKRAMRRSRNKRIVSSGVSGLESSTETRDAPHVDDVDKVEVKKRLVVSPLFRFCQDRKGKFMWRSVEAVLVKEYLDCFSVTENGELKDEIKLDISKVTSTAPLTMDGKLTRKAYSLKAREAETIFKQPFAFVLSCKNDHFFFAAETEVEKNLWVSAINKLIQSNRDKPSSSGKNNRVEASNTINYKEMERDALAEQARLRKQIYETEENIRSISKKYEENDTKWRRRFQDLGYSKPSLDEE